MTAAVLYLAVNSRARVVRYADVIALAPAEGDDLPFRQREGLALIRSAQKKQSYSHFGVVA